MERLQKDFTTLTLATIPVAIAINIAIGQLVILLKLPVYLDSVGTVLVGLLAGPWAGALTGLLSNLIWGLSGINPIYTPFAITAAVIGFLAGVFGNIGWFKVLWKWLAAGVLTGIAAALVSAPISAVVFGGVTGTGQDVLVAFFRATGANILQAATLQGLTADPLDKLVTFLLVWLIVQALPVRYLARFPRSQNVTWDRGERVEGLPVAIVSTFSLFVQRQSGLHGLHPMTKLALVGFCLVAGLALPGAWGGYGVFLLVVLPIALWGRIGGDLMGAVWRVVLPFAVSVFLIQGFLWTGGTPLFHIGPLSLKREGILFAAASTGRILALVSSFLLLSMSTRPDALMLSLGQRGARAASPISSSAPSRSRPASRPKLASSSMPSGLAAWKPKAVCDAALGP